MPVQYNHMINYKQEKQNIAIKQLTGVGGKMKRVKLKVFGCSGIGKSKLIQAMQTGFFGKLFKRRSNVASLVGGIGVLKLWLKNIKL